MAQSEDERVQTLIARILEIKSMIVTGTKYTVEFGVQVERLREEISNVWNEIHALKEINAALVERVESEAPTLPDNPIPLTRISDSQ